MPKAAPNLHLNLLFNFSKKVHKALQNTITTQMHKYWVLISLFTIAISSRKIYRLILLKKQFLQLFSCDFHQFSSFIKKCHYYNLITTKKHTKQKLG